MYMVRGLVGKANVKRIFTEVHFSSERPIVPVAQRLISDLDDANIPRSFNECLGGYEPEKDEVSYSPGHDTPDVICHENVHRVMHAAVSDREHVMAALTLEEPLAKEMEVYHGFSEPRTGLDLVTKENIELIKSIPMVNTVCWAGNLLYNGHRGLVGLLVQTYGVKVLDLMIEPIRMAASTGELQPSLDLIQDYLRCAGVNEKKISDVVVPDFGPAYLVEGEEQTFDLDDVKLVVHSKDDGLTKLIFDSVSGVN
jgi:hypothetical protein